jgi:Peptidase family M28
MKWKLLVLAALTGLPGVNILAQQNKISSDAAQAITVVQPDDIKADITYLADDKLKGRLPGTEGYQVAADYVISQLKKYNVQPAGENNGWLQKVWLRRAFNEKDATMSISTAAGIEQLQYGKDVVIYPNPVHAGVTFEAPVAFAGFGISNPALGYDDYANTNVKGKLVIVLRGAPDNFPSSVAAHSRNFITLQKEAAQHGAVGLIIADADTTDNNMPNFNTSGVYSVLDENGKVVVSRSYYADQIKLGGLMSYSIINKLLKNAGKDIHAVFTALKAGHPQSLPLDTRIKASCHSFYKDINSFNIVGKIPGSDPKLKNEYVVHSAHLDHVGVGVPVEGDSIYNGAHDNASGVASLIQIAKVYAALKNKPKRSVLIVMVTGEELGLLGSGYFASHPTVPIKNIVADVNTDMPTIIAPLLSVTPLGAEHSSLAAQVETAATYLNLTVEKDPEPEQNRFTRSDQYSFVVQGVPALHIKYGNKTPDGKNNLNEFVQKWRARYYHKPQDGMDGIFDFEAGKKYAQLNFLIGYLVANETARPVWNKGDLFEKH